MYIYCILLLAVGRLTFVPIMFALLKTEASRHVTLNGAVRFKLALHPAEPKTLVEPVGDVINSYICYLTKIQSAKKTVKNVLSGFIVLVYDRHTEVYCKILKIRHLSTLRYNQN